MKKEAKQLLVQAEKLAKSTDAHMWTNSSGVRADFPAPKDVISIHQLCGGEPYVHVVVKANHDLPFVNVSLLEAHAPHGVRSFITAFDVDLDGELIVEKSQHLHLWTASLTERVKTTVKTLVELNKIYKKLDPLMPKEIVKVSHDLELTRTEHDLNLTLVGRLGMIHAGRYRHAS